MKGRLMKAFQRNATRIMKEKNISQIELAKRMGSTQATISRILHDDVTPSVYMIEKAADALSVHYLELLEDE